MWWTLFICLLLIVIIRLRNPLYTWLRGKVKESTVKKVNRLYDQDELIVINIEEVNNIRETPFNPHEFLPSLSFFYGFENIIYLKVILENDEGEQLIIWVEAHYWFNHLIGFAIKEN